MRFVSAFVVIAAASVQAQHGPIETRNHRALALPFLRMLPVRGLLEAGETEWSAGWTLANDIRREPPGGPTALEEDQETLRLAFRYRAGLPNGAEWWVELPVLSRGGGILDPIIDGWHKNVLRWSDPLRDSTPMGRSVVRVGGQTFGSAGGIGDVTVGGSKKVGAAEVSLGVKLPTGDASKLLGSGGIDLGLSVSGTLAIAPKWDVFLQAAGILQGSATRLPGTRRFVDQECLALLYRQSEKDTWIAQWQSEGSSLRTGLAGSDRPHRLITFGYRRKIASGQWLEGFFTEDKDLFRSNIPEIASIGPDFTMGLHLIVRK